MDLVEASLSRQTIALSNSLIHSKDWSVKCVPNSATPEYIQDTAQADEQSSTTTTVFGFCIPCTTKGNFVDPYLCHF